MTLRIRTMLGKKLGLPGYSSKTASLEIEAEFAELLLGQPHTLQREIERLFELASQAVDAQLRGPGPGQTERNGEPSEFRPATPAQIHALEELCRAREVDLGYLLTERYFVAEAEELSREQASELISWLQANRGLASTTFASS